MSKETGGVGPIRNQGKGRTSRPLTVGSMVKRHKKKLWLAFGIIVALGVTRWIMLPSGERYFLPRSAEDWIAWGTWAGALGAVGAVVFAAWSVRQAIDAQEQSREDRENDLLAEEERKKNKDEVIRNEAMYLRWRIGTHHGPDAGYQVPDFKDQKARQEKLDKWAPLLFPGEGFPGETQHAIWPLYRIYVLVTNQSEDRTYAELSLELLEEGLNASVIGYKHRELPAPWDGEYPREDESPPEWIVTPIEEYNPLFPPATNRWMVGSLSPRKEVMVVLETDSPLNAFIWDGFESDYEENTTFSRGHLVLTYRDEGNRYWFRSTRSEEDIPYRMSGFTSR